MQKYEGDDVASPVSTMTFLTQKALMRTSSKVLTAIYFVPPHLREDGVVALQEATKGTAFNLCGDVERLIWYKTNAMRHGAASYIWSNNFEDILVAYYAWSDPSDPDEGKRTRLQPVALPGDVQSRVLPFPRGTVVPSAKVFCPFNKDLITYLIKKHKPTELLDDVLQPEFAGKSIYAKANFCVLDLFHGSGVVSVRALKLSMDAWAIDLRDVCYTYLNLQLTTLSDDIKDAADGLREGEIDFGEYARKVVFMLKVNS
jgi:hypothetical protein